MRPAVESAPSRSHRRGLRLFVALHLGAVGAIYAVALAIGGGRAGPPMPPLAAAVAVAATRAPAPASQVEPTAHLVDPTPSRTEGPSTLPAWTQRAEVAAPWEAR